MRLGYGVLVGPENNLCLLVVDVKPTQKKDQAGECCVARDRLQPVICDGLVSTDFKHKNGNCVP